MFPLNDVILFKLDRINKSKNPLNEYSSEDFLYRASQRSL